MPIHYLFLIANIIFSSLFGLCVKYVENRGREDIVTVGMVNYIVAALLSIYEVLHFSEESASSSSWMLGMAMGTSYFVAFFFIIYAVKWIGVTNATVVGILSICVPIIAGVFIWSERPNFAQWIGIVLAMVSLSLIGRKGDATSKGTVPDRPSFAIWVVIGFFILCATSRLSQEAFKHLCTAHERPVFLAAAFLITGVAAAAVVIYRRKSITAPEWWIGSVLGLANFLQTHFILKSLSLLPGFIVFPIVSAGNLLLVTLIATRFMGERLGRLTYIGIGVAVIALFLINLER